MPSWVTEIHADWAWAGLQAVCVGVFDCPHTTPKLTSDEPLVARSQDVRTGIFRHAEAGHVSEATYSERIRRAEPCHGDILFSREGTYFGIAAEVPMGIRVCLGQRMVLLRPDPERLDHRYLRYWLNSPFLCRHIRGLHDGSVAQRINVSTIRTLPIGFPPLPEQRAISRLLGRLDDKIELNRRMNETLEATARAIFRSWFVDFDPVIAKSEGRQPAHMSRETAELFPDSFEESEIGAIPRGWGLQPIGDAVRCVGGGTPRTKEPKYWDGGGCPFATPRDMSRLSCPVMLETERYITEAGVEKIGSGQLPAGTVLLSSRAPIGYLAIAAVPLSVNQGIIAMVCDSVLSNYYVLHWITANMQEIVGRAGGTTFAEISKRSFRPIPALVPTETVVRCYDAVTGPIHLRMGESVRESVALSSIRDALLPRLLSGEIRLREAEKTVEEATR
jgi:type I restriction enzyme, S subunit